MATMHVACAADSGYVRHAAAMLHSILSHSGSLEVRVHFLHGPELERGLLTQLERMVDSMGAGIDCHSIDEERVEGLATFQEITSTMWYRVYLPELVPEAERVLYLDADALALDSLEPLWATDLGSHLVGAVTNVLMPWPEAQGRPAALGLRGADAYFNSGVMLMNLERMRAEETSRQVLDFARSNDLVYPDQDALNRVMASRRLALHPRWNLMNSALSTAAGRDAFDADQLSEARARPGIRHFEGPGLNKPWNRACPFEHRERYFEHRCATPWPRVRMEGPSRGRRLWERLVR